MKPVTMATPSFRLDPCSFPVKFVCREVRRSHKIYQIEEIGKAADECFFWRAMLTAKVEESRAIFWWASSPHSSETPVH